MGDRVAIVAPSNGRGLLEAVERALEQRGADVVAVAVDAREGEVLGVVNARALVQMRRRGGRLVPVAVIDASGCRTSQATQALLDDVKERLKAWDLEVRDVEINMEPSSAAQLQAAQQRRARRAAKRRAT